MHLTVLGLGEDLRLLRCLLKNIKIGIFNNIYIYMYIYIYRYMYVYRTALQQAGRKKNVTIGK